MNKKFSAGVQKKNVRLPKNISPISYNIELEPDLYNLTFTGKENIRIKISKQTNTLVLHAKELEITTAKCQKVSLTDTEMFAKISYDKKNDTVRFVFPKPIKNGEVELILIWRGILNDKMRGFYRSRYEKNGQEHFLATTQFEATDARRAFPCFDEPAHKAVFHVSLIIDKDKTAISNTSPTIFEHEAGKRIFKFSPTPKMSTYLLAFIVGDFEFLEKKSSRGVLVRVHTTPGKKHQAKFALDCAVKTLDFYEKYFDIPYPLPTLDMIAIPDFSSGAMENWGAITYRESAILFDEEKSSLANKQWVALVIAHELAHQWFGNLVTMEWWTHLWLNEGFASYIEYLAVDKMFPSWDIWTQFAVHDLNVALRLDALKNTHPIEVEVHHPDEIGEIFDEVSYSKGASIIRMLASYLGEKDFRDGLRHYLKKHSYKNTETIHLWQAFEKVSGKKVSKIMHTWTSKGGYPVITPKITKEKISFSQKRFFASPISAKKTRDKTKWEIPLIFKHEKPNFGETGFFRVNYGKELLNKLAPSIQNKTLPPIDRLGVIRDLFALSEAGIIDTVQALKFLENYKHEDNYVVLAEIATGLGKIEQLIAKEKNKEFLNKIILKIFSPIVISLGWKKRPTDTHVDILLRSLSLSRVGRSKDESVIKEARNKFQELLKNKKIESDIRGAVYTIVASNGGMKEFKILLEKYKKEKLHEEKNRIGATLGDFTDSKILEQVCEFAMSKHVRPQDSVSILSSVGNNPLGRDIWLNFIKKNWKTLISRYGEGGLTLSRAIKAIGGSAEEKHLKEIRKFFTNHEAPGAKRTVEQLIEKLEANVAWLKRDKKSINKYLSKMTD